MPGESALNTDITSSIPIENITNVLPTPDQRTISQKVFRNVMISCTALLIAATIACTQAAPPVGIEPTSLPCLNIIGNVDYGYPDWVTISGHNVRAYREIDGEFGDAGTVAGTLQVLCSTEIDQIGFIVILWGGEKLYVQENSINSQP